MRKRVKGFLFKILPKSAKFPQKQGKGKYRNKYLHRIFKRRTLAS